MKKTFPTKILLSVCIFGLFLSSCKKDGGSDSTYYIKANIEGKEKRYSSTPMAASLNQYNTYSFTFSARASSSSEEGLSLQVSQPNTSITAGTYSTPSWDNYDLGGVYVSGSIDGSYVYMAGGIYTSPLQLVITSISDKEVSGTFSGKFYDNGGGGSNSVTITNGVFKLPIQ